MLPESTPARCGSLMILAPISLGELIDRITILQIKSRHLSGTALENVVNQLRALEATLDGLNLGIHPELVQQLKAVNAGLWNIENEIREKERSQDFGDAFIRLARSVYQQNDRRAVIKKEINTAYGSVFVEEKTYPVKSGSPGETAHSTRSVAT